MKFDRLKNLSVKEKYIMLSIVMVFVFAGIIFYIQQDNTELASTKKTQGIVDSEEGNIDVASSAKDVEIDVAEILDSKAVTLGVRVPIFTLMVDGKDMGMFESEEEVDDLLDTISMTYLEENSEIKDVKYKEDIYVIKSLVTIEEFETRVPFESLLYSITKGTDEKRIHKVQKGENYWVIAKHYNISPEDLIKANPDVVPERLQIGQEISLIVPKPLITTITSEVVEYTEYIDYETKYEETQSLFKGEYRVKKAGVKGEKQVKAMVSKENGIEVSKTVIDEVKLKDPVTKVVVKGMKDPPPKIGTGVLAKPTSRGYVTSPFGMRWGRRHNGIDIGMPIGTEVKASDGGKIIFSGYKGGYGYCVIIDHGANVRTLYAHNSKLLVKKGQKVYKGQTVAKSGNSGRSTGPHLHFEVLKNGKPVNPAKYVKY